MATRQIRPTSILTINTGDGAAAENHSYPMRTPVLAVRFGTAQIQISLPAWDKVTTADLDFARQLAKEAHDFAVSCERIYRGRKGVAA
ncbi:hypothetical protein OIE66_39595 [Nonomuraea sp. NBC_01738]|uniref:hypothetical protein n=1 Tax=Nonomuraea sp. NBC_01738 TaxID=2976003 RepID=UPI002E112CC1|nr:hypothetical protein OIE66_39595 [Nonomuraea sp. NBC_01738]